MQEAGPGNLEGSGSHFFAPRETIALRIDAEKEPELASRFKVNAYPTLALIRPDGTLIDSLVGYRDAPTFSKEFAAILAGKTQFALAREALEKAGADVEKQVKARYDLGRVLAQKATTPVL